jgi:hypothetical protein
MHKVSHLFQILITIVNLKIKHNKIFILLCNDLEWGGSKNLSTLLGSSFMLGPPSQNGPILVPCNTHNNIVSK